MRLCYSRPARFLTAVCGIGLAALNGKPATAQGGAPTTAPSAAIPQTPAASTIPLSQYTVQRVAGPIKIDGVLDEPSWQRAASTVSWPDVHGQDPGSIRTTSKVLWDDKTLYVAFNVADTDVQASRTLHDSDIYFEDCVELFIEEQANKDVVKGYLEYEINALGTRFDAYNVAPLRAAAGWDSKGWRCAVKVDGTLNNKNDVDKGWVVEMSIPFFDLYAGPFIDETLALREYGHMGPRPGTQWRANFYRMKHTPTGVRYLAWSPTLRQRFHVPNRFGIFTFSSRTVGEPEPAAPQTFIRSF